MMDKLLRMFLDISIHDLSHLETDIAIWAGFSYDYTKDDNPICDSENAQFCTKLMKTSNSRPQRQGVQFWIDKEHPQERVFNDGLQP